MASSAAFVPRSLVISVVAICLCSIPVRFTIHSSLVSTIFSKSKFVKIFSGTYDAMEINEAFGIFYLAKCESSSSITLFIFELANLIA